MLLLLVLFALGLFVLLFYQKQNYIKRCLQQFPQPPIKNVVLGHLGNFKADEVLEHFCELIKTYGSMVLIRYATVYTLIIADNKFAERVLSEPKNLSKSKTYSFLSKWLGQGLLLTTEKNWAAQRKMLMPAFHYKILENFVPIYNSSADKLVEKFQKLTDKDCVNVFEYVKLCTLDIICESAMGVSIKAQDEENSEYIHSVKSMCDIIINRTVHPLKIFNLTYFLTSDFWTERRLLKIMHDFTDGVIAQRRAERAERKGDITDKRKKVFLDMLLDYSDNERKLTKSELRQEVDTFMFAGHDTSTAAICFTLHELANNPEIQAEAYEEQRAIFNEDRNRSSTPQDLQKMRYLEAVIKESLRLYPPVSIYSRKCEHEFKYDGQTIPEGITLLFCVFALHRDPKLFEDPLKFDPERFLDDRHFEPFSYLPFSGGPRNCIGNKIAMQEMKVVLSKILRNLEILPLNPPHKVQPTAKVVLVSKNGVFARFRDRS